MQIKHDDRDVIIIALKKLLKQHGYSDDVINVSGNDVSINLTSSKKDINFAKSLREKFLLKYSTDVYENDRKELLQSKPDETIVYLIKDTLLVFDFLLYITNEVDKNQIVGDDNVTIFTNKYLECDTKLFTDLEVVNLFDEVLKNIKSSRLKTLDISNLLDLVEKRLYQYAIKKIENPTFRSKDDLLNVSYWNVINLNNNKDKPELIIYLTYLSLKEINSGIPLEQSINKVLDLSNFDLRIICSFYGELGDVNSLYNEYIETYNLDETFIDNQELELTDFEDSDSELNQIIFKFINVIHHELGVLLPESVAKEMLGNKYKKLTKFNLEGVPSITSDIKDNLAGLVTFCSNSLAENSNVPFTDIRNVAEKLIKSDKFIKLLTIYDVKEILESVHAKSQVTDKFKELLFNEITIEGLMEANANKTEMFDSLISTIENSKDIENILEDILYKIKAIEDNKILNKTQLTTIETKLTSTVSLRTNELIREENMDSVINLYRIIFKGGM